jgi:predicted transcriptional regulator
MTEKLKQTALAAMTAKIVSVYVAHNQIAASDLVTLVGAVAGEFNRAGTRAEQPVTTDSTPVVPVRRSITSDHLICLVCGNKQRLLKRHLRVEHGLTPAQYRDTFKLKPDYPMTAPSYTQQRRELALKTGLGRPRKKESRRRKSSEASS